MNQAKISGLSHLTLAVSNLEKSISFYRDLLGFELRARWPEGAYLEAGTLWLCLTVEDEITKRADYTHIAFSVTQGNFTPLVNRLRNESLEWQANSSEGASFYFLDPDGHRLEVHVGSLASRLAHGKGKR